MRGEAPYLRDEVGVLGRLARHLRVCEEGLELFARFLVPACRRAVHFNQSVRLVERRQRDIHLPVALSGTFLSTSSLGS